MCLEVLIHYKFKCLSEFTSREIKKHSKTYSVSIPLLFHESREFNKAQLVCGNSSTFPRWWWWCLQTHVTGRYCCCWLACIAWLCKWLHAVSNIKHNDQKRFKYLQIQLCRLMLTLTLSNLKHSNNCLVLCDRNYCIKTKHTKCQKQNAHESTMSYQTCDVLTHTIYVSARFSLNWYNRTCLTGTVNNMEQTK